MTENRIHDTELERVSGGVEAAPEPGPTPSGSIVSRAQQELGKPYAWCGVGPSAYDSSGLVSYCISGAHTRIGTCQTFMGWPRVSNPVPGDICVSSTHCGIYTAPGTMIHAPTFGAVVSYGSIQGDMIIVRYPG